MAACLAAVQSIACAKVMAGPLPGEAVAVAMALCLLSSCALQLLLCWLSRLALVACADSFAAALFSPLAARLLAADCPSPLGHLALSSLSLSLSLSLSSLSLSLHLPDHPRSPREPGIRPPLRLSRHLPARHRRRLPRQRDTARWADRATSARAGLPRVLGLCRAHPRRLELEGRDGTEIGPRYGGSRYGTRLGRDWDEIGPIRCMGRGAHELASSCPWARVHGHGWLTHPIPDLTTRSPEIRSSAARCSTRCRSGGRPPPHGLSSPSALAPVAWLHISRGQPRPAETAPD